VPHFSLLLREVGFRAEDHAPGTKPPSADPSSQLSHVHPAFADSHGDRLEPHAVISDLAFHSPARQWSSRPRQFPADSSRNRMLQGFRPQVLYFRFAQTRRPHLLQLASRWFQIFCCKSF